MGARHARASLGRKITMIGRLTQFTAALLAAASLIVAPVYAQAQEAQQQSTQEPAAQQQNTPAGQNPAGVQPPSQPQAQTGAAVVDPARDLRLGAGPDYSREKFFIPNVIDPYKPPHVAEPMLTNSTRIDQLIQDGKLMLSLDDAI